jgi:choline dehydrogenase-like flavoprotein
MLSFSRIRLTKKVQWKEELLNYQANLYFGYAAQDTEQWDALRRIVFVVRRRHTPYFPEDGGGRNVIRWTDVRTALIRPDHTLLSLVGASLRPIWLRSWVEIMSSVEQPPLPNNRVVLSDEKDELGVNLPKLNWSISAQEERTYRRGLDLVLEKLERYSPEIRNARISDTDPWPAEITGTWHHIGTTRMHENPQNGVVDANCRVHGVRNLFVAGSSVFPTGGSHSPTLTIIALALRLADHLNAKSAVC